jgi:hypothetical protein
MEQRRPRSKRQLYLGIFFVSLAILAALLRSGFPSASTGTGGASEFVGLTVTESVDQLGEPTTRVEFYPDEDFHAERAALIDRLQKAGEPVPEVFVELAWFQDGEIVTLRFPAEFDENGEVIVSSRSIDAQRSPRTPTE